MSKNLSSLTAPASSIRVTSKGWVLSASVLLLCFMATLSLLVGTRPIAPASVLNALIAYDPNLPDHIIIHDYRLPRTLLGLLCGAAFAMSGALIQAATRNPLADPGLLGVNAGAAFFVTVAIGMFGFHSLNAYVLAALAGAISATLFVYILGGTGREGATPVRLVLAGVALSAVLAGITSSITLLNPRAFDTMRFWAIGSLAGRDMNVVTTVAPFMVIGMVLGLVASRPLNAVALGNELAQSLGADIHRARVLVVLSVTLLAGAATAAVGPISFVGLMVPHVVRWFTGPDQRWIIGMTIIFGPTLLLAADILGRLVVFPGELEAGIVTAFIGAPILILFARRPKASGL
ncbi:MULTISPECIES: iron chelate uptake ABC transporter family permease subunit [Brucella]|uniref:ABC-type Fe3+-siderophore transport system, permease component n=1 Tax=Ochrobactrum soli TaxID=2448455 RepID=A0A2P9HCL6_9HYPH|nr:MULTISPECIES: iron chelate uptake ABC transporter family permease subunit [Brucella]MDX4072162.1 iron chelate uptake ABC transporter family permease subunit [Brucella sp. NBRC 113783]SPL61590.1 ABC-type Fe3+-siderophore transport system, permease component [[Ochrobactrum] soli]